jgi:hypothetical protein
MTTGTGPEPPGWRVRWAAEQLGVREEASAAEARAAFLRRLPAAHFVPETSQRLALGVLCRQPIAPGSSGWADEEACLAEEARLRGLVEDLAEHYWGVPPQERRRQWEELVRSCTGFPALEARLRSLRAGLEVIPRLTDETDASIRELGRQILDLYVRRPAERGPARQALIRRMLLRMDFWQETARQLQERHPDIARLQSELLEGVATWRTRQRQLEKNRKRLYARKPAAAASGGGYKGWSWGAGVLVFVVVRVFVSLLNSSPPSSRPALDSSRYQWELSAEKMKLELEKMKAEEPTRKALEEVMKSAQKENNRKDFEEVMKSVKEKGNKLDPP